MPVPPGAISALPDGTISPDQILRSIAPLIEANGSVGILMDGPQLDENEFPGVPRRPDWNGDWPEGYCVNADGSAVYALYVPENGWTRMSCGVAGTVEATDLQILVRPAYKDGERDMYLTFYPRNDGPLAC